MRQKGGQDKQTDWQIIYRDKKETGQKRGQDSQTERQYVDRTTNIQATL
jgi:hypothetical protein